MAMKFTQASVGTAPALIWQQVPAQGANFIMTNSSAANIVYIGSSTAVTTLNGAPIPPYGIVSMHDIIGTAPVYGVCTSAAGTVAVGIFYGDLQ